MMLARTMLRAGATALAPWAVLIGAAAASAQSSPSAWTSATRYDAVGQVTGTIAPDPDGTGALAYAAVRNSYDPGGRLIKVEHGELVTWQSETVAPSAWTGFDVHRTRVIAYDIMGRKTREVLSSEGVVQAVTQYSYDARGRLECTAVRMNPALWPNAAGTGGTLPASACTLGAAGTGANAFGPDRISRNVYDAAGQRLQRRAGVGTADEGAEATWGYNRNGQITTVIDGNGNRAELTYNDHGRQNRWRFPSATRPTSFDDSTPATALATAGAVNVNDYESYGYDAHGNRTSLRTRHGLTLRYTYDALNRVTFKEVPERSGLTASQTRDVYYAYDLRGLMTAARFDSLAGVGVSNAYDGFGRQLSSTIDMGSAVRTLSYQYDRNGNRIRITHPDGTYFTGEYDGLNRFKRWRENGGASLTGFAYNAQGLVSLRSNQNAVAGQQTYSYDGVGRLTGLVANPSDTASDITWTYSHNPAGQVRQAVSSNDAYAWTSHYAVNRAYTTNGRNQYTQAGTVSFGYDANGNLSSEGGRTFLYDIENRLVSATGAADAQLVYDPLGRLFQVTDDAGVKTRFLYDGDALVAEYDGSNLLLRRYVHAAGADMPTVWYEGATLADRRYLYADHQGSIIGVVDSNGALIAANAYDEYGIPRTGNLGRFQYTGQAWLTELGMYHYKSRIYSPTLGRFLQTDPIGYQGGINLYAYVYGDPLNLIDPMGHSGCDDMARQGLTGPCIDSTNLQEEDRVRRNGTVERNNLFDNDAINTPATEERSRQYANATNQENGNESLHRIDVNGEESTLTEVPTTNATPWGVEFDPDDIAGAEAVVHPHPTSQNTIVPGPGDWQAPARGVPNNNTHGRRVIATEISGGQIRFRVLEGTITPAERDALRARANEFQEHGRDN